MGSTKNTPTRLNPFRVGVVDCQIQEEYILNDDFAVDTRRGSPQFFVDGEVQFPPSVKPDGTYRTKFGGASHNGLVYADTNHNLRYAVRRLLGKRVPEIPGRHEELLRRQEMFIDSQGELKTRLRELYEHHFDTYTDSETEARLHYADPHPKKVLREQCFKEMEQDNKITDSEDPYAKSVWWKIKKNEWAKPKKKPRAICDLGVACSMRGFRVTNFLKEAQDECPLDFLGGRFVFCKSPDPFALARHFECLRNPPGRFYFLYFSDDSCLAIRNPMTGEVDWYNLDISSCDASHGPKIFEFLEDIMPAGWPRHDVQILINQLKLPLRVRSRDDPTIKMYINHKHPILMSGSTLTTAVNNIANLMIGVSLVMNYSGRHYQGENPEMVNAAAAAGYILTGCTPLSCFQDVQFLKHSPVRDIYGNWHPMLNFGVMVRASMTCNGDIPGRGPLRDRAKSFQRGLLSGAYPYTSFGLLDCMKDAVGQGDEIRSDVFHWKVVDDAWKYPMYRLNEEDIRIRYRLDQSELDDLYSFARLPIYHFLHNDGVSKVLMKDYGLETTECNLSKYIGHPDSLCCAA